MCIYLSMCRRVEVQSSVLIGVFLMHVPSICGPNSHVLDFTFRTTKRNFKLLINYYYYYFNLVREYIFSILDLI